MVTRRALAHTELLSRSELYGAAIEVLIDVDFAVSREREWHRRRLAHAIGRRTDAERRERRERRLRTELSAGRAHSRRPPVAFWHEGGHGPTLLLLNGWGASGLSWPSAWLERLEQRFRVVRIDNRGSGYSRTAPAPFTMAQIVLVASRPPSPASIHSSERVIERTFAAGPAPGQDLREYLWGGWAAMCAPGFAVAHPELFDELASQSAARLTPRTGFIHQMRAMAAWRGADRLRDISAPTTVVHGDVDPLTPVGNGMRLARLIPGARSVELPRVGHLVAVEAGEQLADVVEARSEASW